MTIGGAVAASPAGGALQLAMQASGGHGSFTLTGALSGGQIALTAPSSIVSLGGLISGNSLTVNAGSSALTQFGTISVGSVSFQAPSSTLTLAGPITGDSVAVSAPFSTVTLQGAISGNSISVTGPATSIVLASGSSFAGLGGTGENPLRSQPFPTPGAPGLYLQADAISNLNPNLNLSGSRNISATFALTGGGTVNLGNLQAPNTTLFLDLGNGSATGQINVAGLHVRYGPPTSEKVNLRGSVAGVSGFGAAAISLVTPAPLANYQLPAQWLLGRNELRYERDRPHPRDRAERAQPDNNPDRQQSAGSADGRNAGGL
ncbi:MAG: hypothetical protein ACJ8AI_14350 [Rhodopila sp.]